MKILTYLLLFIVSITSISAIGYHYEIQIINNETGFLIENARVELGEISEEESFVGGNVLQVKSFDFKTLYQTNFETIGNSIVEGDLGNGYFESKMIYYNITEINLLIPYYANAKEIVIYNKNLEEVTRIDVSMYSKQYEKVEETTLLNKSVEEEPFEEKNKKTSSVKNLSEKLTEYWWILLIVLVILLIVFFYSLKKR